MRIKAEPKDLRICDKCECVYLHNSLNCISDIDACSRCLPAEVDRFDKEMNKVLKITHTVGTPGCKCNRCLDANCVEDVE